MRNLKYNLKFREGSPVVLVAAAVYVGKAIKFQSASFDETTHGLSCMRQKIIAPFYFCNNFVKPYFIWIILAHGY